MHNLLNNVYWQFRQLIPDPPLQAGTVIDVGSGVVTVELPGGVLELTLQRRFDGA